MNRNSHISSSPISQSSFFEEVRCLILASSQRKIRGHIEFLKFDITRREQLEEFLPENRVIGTTISGDGVTHWALS